ncbi:hypothetical protein FQN54_004042 [Arachnomyces sp. PD_36]|nr:hypothetical protein FQN54_004042 [Arachnomyces sp. PD_36]
MAILATTLISLVPVTVGLVLIIGVISIPLYCIYEIFFHPFAGYPGPPLAKLTALRGTYHVWRGDVHLDMWRCHQKYGPIVRYGPDHLLFDTANGMRDVLGPGKNFEKGGSYKRLHTGALNILTMADRKKHGKRRRLLGPWFTDKALKEFEPESLSRIRKFCAAITPAQAQSNSPNGWGSPVDMTHLFSFLVFDTLNALVFGLDRKLIEAHQHRSVIADIEELLRRSAVLLYFPLLYLGRIDKAIFPEAEKASRRVSKYMKGVLQEHSSRASSGKVSTSKNVLSYLQVTKDPETGESLSPSESKAEAVVMTIAGSDASSSAFCAIMFYLITNPHVYSKLATEVRSTFTSEDEIQTGEKLRSCRYLRACVDESLRMSPPVGQSLFRDAGPGGAFVDGHYIPAGYGVGTGIYSLHHNPTYFPRPFSFHPERWLVDTSGLDGGSTPEQLELAKSAYIPFSMGSRSCIAKSLALNKMQVTIAILIWKFDFKMADGPGGELGAGNPLSSEFGRTNPGEFQLYSHVTSTKKGPVVQFRPRVVAGGEGVD